MTLVVLLLAVAAFAPGKRPGICCAVNLVLVVVINQVLKFIIQRPRPDGFRLAEATGFSFPSGHSMVAMAFFGLLVWFVWNYEKDRKLRCLYVVGFAIVIVMIGISRIYLGVHYASDVLGGFCLSMAWLAVYTRVAVPLSSTRMIWAGLPHPRFCRSRGGAPLAQDPLLTYFPALTIMVATLNERSFLRVGNYPLGGATMEKLASARYEATWQNSRSVCKTSRKTRCSVAFRLLSVVLLLALSLVIEGFAGLHRAYADDGIENSATLTLKNGGTCDLSTLKSKTKIVIDESGVYTLKGSSTKAYLDISDGNDVLLVLDNGLSLVNSQYGSAPAIAVHDKGGTVAIRTKAGATAKVEGYFAYPGIQKNGKNTKLVFDTEDPDNPGTLNAYGSQGTSGGPGIGTTPKSMGGYKTTGNIVIKSGNLNAKGGTWCAGIGGGDHGNLDGLTVEGGEINATGGGNVGWISGGGAGIGGGRMGNCRNVTISGGSVTAKGGPNSAGIGGGQKSTSNGGYADNIKITGGTVKATGGYGGAGIGGGWESDTGTISISGGNVEGIGGTSYASGIGGGGGNYYGTAKNILISGGVVKGAADKLGTGIGSNFHGNGSTSVTISGGEVAATGAGGCYAIGGGGKNGLSKGGTTSITISGGTISATTEKKSVDFGTDNSGDGGFSLAIIGGSVNARVPNSAVNQAGEKVARTQVLLSGVTDRTKVTRCTVLPTGDESQNTAQNDDGRPSYGFNDVYTLNNNMLYFYLPANKDVVFAETSEGAAYMGTVHSGKSGTLFQGAKVVLNENGGAQAGEGVALIGAKELRDYTPVQRDGYNLLGYSSDSAGTTIVVDKNGAFVPDTAYTDSSGKWASRESSLTLYAQWQAKTYLVRFDSNKPDGCSTDITGSMADEGLIYDTTQTLTPCGYVLPGYTFKEWNTKADGTGTSYTDSAEVKNIVEASSKSITLYAQWAPREYEISFELNGAMGYMYPKTARFDETVALPKINQDTIEPPSGKTFTGWSRRGAVGSYYKDEAKVCNLCTINPDGTINNVTLTASWANEGTARIAITNDYQPIDSNEYADKLSLVAYEGVYPTGATYKGFKNKGNGIYELDEPTVSSQPAVLPPGLYAVNLEGEDTTGKMLIFENGKINTVYLDYYTVEIQSENHAYSWIGQAGTRKINNVLGRSRLQIGTTTDEGYVFESYTAQMCDPFWEGDNPKRANQTVGVQGTTIIEAHPAPTLYQVSFGANGGNGTMENQAFVYDEPQELFANAFMRTGYEFAGWSTASEWDGNADSLYKDKESVQNLCFDGSTVVLYAQWQPNSYFVEFNGNGSDTGMMLPQKFFYDGPQNLSISTMSKADHHFVGWNTLASGEGVAYSDAQEVVNLATEKDAVITLWAQWEHDYYTVGYNANGGSGDMPDQIVYTNASECLIGNDFARDGYTFAGWNTQADGTGAAYEEGAEIYNAVGANETLTLYAQWSNDPDPTPEPSPIPGPDPDPAPGQGGVPELRWRCW